MSVAHLRCHRTAFPVTDRQTTRWTTKLQDTIHSHLVPLGILLVVLVLLLLLLLLFLVVVKELLAKDEADIIAQFSTFFLFLFCCCCWLVDCGGLLRGSSPASSLPF